MAQYVELLGAEYRREQKNGETQYTFKDETTGGQFVPVHILPNQYRRLIEDIPEACWVEEKTHG